MRACTTTPDSLPTPCKLPRPQSHLSVAILPPSISPTGTWLRTVTPSSPIPALRWEGTSQPVPSLVAPIPNSPFPISASYIDGAVVGSPRLPAGPLRLGREKRRRAGREAAPLPPLPQHRASPPQLGGPSWVPPKPHTPFQPQIPARQPHPPKRKPL